MANMRIYIPKAMVFKAVTTLLLLASPCDSAEFDGSFKVGEAPSWQEKTEKSWQEEYERDTREKLEYERSNQERMERWKNKCVKNQQAFRALPPNERWRFVTDISDEVESTQTGGRSFGFSLEHFEGVCEKMGVPVRD